MTMNRQAAKLYKKDPRGQTLGLLGQTETTKALVPRKENGEIQDYLCMENSPNVELRPHIQGGQLPNPWTKNF